MAAFVAKRFYGSEQATLIQDHAPEESRPLYAESCKAAIPLDREEGGNARHIAIDGKTMRASKDSEGKAEHVLSAFCSSLQTVLGHEASRSKGLISSARAAPTQRSRDRQVSVQSPMYGRYPRPWNW